MSAPAPARATAAVGLIGAGATAGIARDRFRYQKLGNRRDAERRGSLRRCRPLSFLNRRSIAQALCLDPTFALRQAMPYPNPPGPPFQSCHRLTGPEPVEDLAFLIGRFT